MSNMAVAIENRELTSDELNLVQGGVICEGGGYKVVVVDYGAFMMPMLALATNCQPGSVSDIGSGCSPLVSGPGCPGYR
jgi:hypothetical protein